MSRFTIDPRVLDWAAALAKVHPSLIMVMRDRYLNPDPSTHVLVPEENIVEIRSIVHHAAYGATEWSTTPAPRTAPTESLLYGRLEIEYRDGMESFRALHYYLAAIDEHLIQLPP